MTNEPAPLPFRFGLLGAVAPLLVFVGGVGALAVAGAPDERGFWPVLLVALIVSRLLARDGKRWSDAVLGGIGQPIVAVIVLAWLLSGLLGAILTAGGLVDGVAWAATAIGAGPVAIVGVAFVGCALLATATGTSFGTLLVAGPVLFGAGTAVGASPAVLLGAILAGATWGDSISPVSDTSIASAGSQGTDVAGTVRSRLRYVVPAGLVALAASLALAMTTAPPVGTGADATLIRSRPDGLVLLVVPVVVIALLARGRSLLDGLLLGLVTAAGIALTAGLIAPATLLRVEPGAFGATGVLIDGLQRGIGVSVFTILLMGLIGPLQASGALDRLIATVATGEISAPRAETVMTGIVTVAVFLTTHSIVAILAVGPLVRRLGESAGITAYRRANLLDLTVCIWPFLLPWFLPTILAASVTAGDAGVPRVSPLAAGLHNTYAWTLLVTVLVAVVTGYGRSRDRSS
ncbi:MAG: Na+/H+ antiporter NhaC family protein [Gemmatimonadota bacterium]|nr:Na+/H+ antiporter NhaC family protein [Gemmatimonadota bacterium]MDQ8149910.1 Na+/H+ antiporter NhaC family protein [Gemmatimonadota bacterium]